MCGLFGFIHLGQPILSPADIQAGKAALDTLAHRGPDQHDSVVLDNLFMGHRRLSILDLSEEGRQPMQKARALITVNGEIYNYKALREALGESRFHSTSDSEVVLHGYPDWGLTTLLENMDGMYACAIYDPSRKTLHLARDRAGIKPLLYARLGAYFLWASELKAILCFARTLDLPLTRDSTALFDFLTYRYIPAPKTLYHNVYALPPAHSLSLPLATGQETLQRYWTLPTSDAPVHHGQAAEQLRALIHESVAEQMVSDVPLGFFLSGGMDSSILVTEAASLRPDLLTFSIGYDHKAHDETAFAKIVADQCHTDHHIEILQGTDAEHIIPMILNWYDGPFGDASALPTYHVCRFAKRFASVALSGDGGDELFGGYRWYQRFARLHHLQKFLPVPFHDLARARATQHIPLQKLLLRLDMLSQRDPLALYTMLIDGLPPALTQHYRAELEIPKDYDALWFFRVHDRPALPLRKRMQALDFHTFLPDDILTKVDRVSMAVSLEARVPFLSRALIEYAFSLPENFLYKNNTLKGGLKYTYKDRLPPAILNRGKKGFSLPLHLWNSPQDHLIRFQERVFFQYTNNIPI